MPSKILYTTDRNAAEHLSNNPTVAVECDYNGDSFYQTDVWVRGIDIGDESLLDESLFDGGVYAHPVAMLKAAKELIEYINTAYPEADIVIIDCIAEQGIRNSLDIQAKHDTRSLIIQR